MIVEWVLLFFFIFYFAKFEGHFLHQNILESALCSRALNVLWQMASADFMNFHNGELFTIVHAYWARINMNVFRLYILLLDFIDLIVF